MPLYPVTVLLGLLALLLARRRAAEEASRRKARYTTLLHTRFSVEGAQSGADLWCTYYVVGRRKRRCDLCLDHLKDGDISRVHAILWYDGEGFCIAPARNIRPFAPDKYPPVFVNSLPVSPEGMAVHYGDEIRMGNSRFTLTDTRGEEDAA